MTLLPVSSMVPLSADYLYVRLSLSGSLAAQTIWDSDKTSTSFSAVRELITGGWFGGGGGGGGGGGEQAPLKSSEEANSKTNKIDRYFIGDLFHLGHIMVHSFWAFLLAPFPRLVNHVGEDRKPPGCTNIMVNARAKSTISSESDCRCVIEPNISSHIPKHSHEENFILPWLMYQALLAMKAMISGSDIAAMRRGQMRKKRSIASANSI